MRRPDTPHVYQLGHYEQMLLARAMVVSTDRQAPPLNDKERADVAGLLHIFAQPGIVTILKEAER